MATFSTWSNLSSQVESSDTDASENIDQDMSLTTPSDGSSSGDSRVVAKSVEGEDDIVDVTMQDASERGKTAEPEVSREYVSCLNHEPLCVSDNKLGPQKCSGSSTTLGQNGLTQLYISMAHFKTSSS